MNPVAEAIAPEPFFLPGTAGRLFALRIAPASNCSKGRAAIFFPPFAEEMNKARRCVALQARALAEAGMTVLLVDPFGTGDSEGDFADGRWSTWHEDALRCIAWLGEQGADRVVLWGLRLGAALAVDVVEASPLPVERLVLWQPVTRGSVMVNQFLRLRVAAEMDKKGSGTSTQALRHLAEREGSVEVAGYRMTRELLYELDGLDLERISPRRQAAADWIEVVPEAGRGPNPVSRTIVDRWRGAGVDVSMHTIVGGTFWNTVEITVPVALIQATCEILNPA